MIELIYYSIASTSLSKEDVYNILEVSQKNNLQKNITGCMLYYNDAFIQILEGDAEAIEVLYSKIEADQRHYNIRQVYRDEKKERLFKDWSMAFYDLDKNDDPKKDKLIFRENFKEISLQTDQSSMASQLFWDISREIINE